MTDRIGHALIDQATATPSPNPSFELKPGIHRVEVVGDMGAATVQIRETMDPDTDDWKEDPEVLLSAAVKTSEMIRGGVYISAVITGVLPGPISVLVGLASSR